MMIFLIVKFTIRNSTNTSGAQLSNCTSERRAFLNRQHHIPQWSESKNQFDVTTSTTTIVINGNINQMYLLLSLS